MGTQQSPTRHGSYTSLTSNSIRLHKHKETNMATKLPYFDKTDKVSLVSEDKNRESIWPSISSKNLTSEHDNHFARLSSRSP